MSVMNFHGLELLSSKSVLFQAGLIIKYLRFTFYCMQMPYAVPTITNSVRRLMTK